MKLTNLFNKKQRWILADLHAKDQRERDAGVRELMSLKALRPQVAELLVQLILHKGAETIVEFGTSHGYSAIYLAAAAERTGGHVYTVELIAEKTSIAQANLEAAGLRERVTLSTCDGVKFAESLPHDIDFVLIDYGIPAFVPAFQPLRDRIAPGGLLFVDGGNEGYWESDGVREFKAKLEADPDFVVSILTMHREQLVAVRLPT